MEDNFDVVNSSVNVEENANQIQRSKKKKTKIIESILRDLPQGATDEEKFDAICQKYQEQLSKDKEYNTRITQFEKALNSVRAERDQLQNERNRFILQKDKLETLCRELQKQNKIIQDENLARNRAEEEKRREIADHFQTSITGIQTQLGEYQIKNNDLRQENLQLAAKLEQFIKQHEHREAHVEKVLNARSIEVKLVEAKLNKADCLLDQEKVKHQHKIQQMEEQAQLAQHRMDMHLNLENKLKEQIEFYKNKYQSFNKTITQSNQMFENCKAEMEKLGKRVKQSERDVVEWRGKWELSQRRLLEVMEEHHKQSEEASSSRKQVERLQGLCRALQTQLRQVRGEDVQQLNYHPTTDQEPVVHAPSQSGDGPTNDSNPLSVTPEADSGKEPDESVANEPDATSTAPPCPEDSAIPPMNDQQSDNEQLKPDPNSP